MSKDERTKNLLAEPTLSTDAGTRVDLGEDLLKEKTQVHTSSTAAFPPTAPKGSARGPVAADQIQDHLESARILIGEGIFEESKRILHQLLLSHPRHPDALVLLEDVRERELKALLSGTDAARRRFGKSADESVSQVSAEWVMRDLDRDLGLGLFNAEGAETSELALSLFRDERAMEEFGAKMDREFASCHHAERIDIGIAFLEMGLYGLAIRHFRAAADQLSREEGPEITAERLSAAGLLGYALIAGGRALDATLAMQSLINDSDITPEGKLDLVYLMGRAYEALGKREVALLWYRRAAGIDPHYRDLDERLKT